MKKTVYTNLFYCLLLCSTFAFAQEPADWMSGKWGVGFRINADDKKDITNYNPSTLVSQIQSIGGVNHILVNLTDAAHGDAYLAPHSVLTKITPSATPDNNRDLFMELAQAFQAAGIKVIAYMATQGPAMLKHGAEKAYDGRLVNGKWESQAMNNWADHVKSVYGNTNTSTYERAYAEIIVDEFAKRYGTLVDGWWFDHANYGDIPLLRSTINKYNPKAAIAFNDGQKVPLINNNPGYEDFTAGHVNPIASTISSSNDNLPMVTSIEASSNGYLNKNGELSLGHIFMPMQEKWNSGDIVWPEAQAIDWMNRTLSSGGGWTWNVTTDDPRSQLANAQVNFMKSITNSIIQSNTTAGSNKIVRIIKRNANYAIHSSGTGANGQNVTLWEATNPSENLDWIEIDRGSGYYSYQRQNTDFCIDGGVGGARNQNIYLWKCDNNNQNQQWQKVDAGNGAVKLVKRNTNFAINGGNNGSNYQNINLFDASNSSQNLQWIITPQTTIVRIIKRNSNYALHSSGNGANAQDVTLWDSSHPSENLNWIEIDRGNGYYSYQRENTDHCIDGGEPGASNNQNVYLWSCNANNQNQQWQKVATDNGFIKLVKRNDAFAIHSSGAGSNGQNVTLWSSSHTSHNLQWSITAVSPGTSAKSVANVTTTDEVIIYPNPVVNIATIQGAANTIIHIYDMTGKELLVKEIQTDNEAIDLSVLATGVFYAQIKGLDNISVIKIVKE